MGDIDVDFFLKTLNQLITSSYLDVVIDKKDQLQSLEKEIKHLREFLRDTEKKRNEYSKVMDLVMQIRDVVSKVENSVELFVSYESKKERENAIFDHQVHLSLELESVGKEIETLTTEVKKIYNENMYDISGVPVKQSSNDNGGGGSSSSRGEKKSQVIEEKEVVGFEDDVNTLMGKLHDNGEGGKLEIISITGVGGGGKTTLARQVYDRPLTLQKFEIRAWVNLSQEYNTSMKRDLLNSILESASQGVVDRESNENVLGEKVHKCLKGKKYLIVMDDIWSIEAWNDIQISFPRQHKGSKVLFTSRVPVRPDGINYVSHALDLLSESCSWELLQKKVFEEQQCPPEFVGMGKQIAKKCGGLPLAIVAIAGILTKDKTLDMWEKVAAHLSSIISQESCMEILELSYNHLPLHLKACFLYIGGHEEDSEIPVRELMWLWIAEGFIQQSEAGKNLEAIAEDYLVELIDRNLVMVARKSKYHGGIEACCIHDLLRELCLKKAGEDNFLLQSYGYGSFSPSTTNKLRRLFTGPHLSGKFPPRPRAQNLRSFLSTSSSDIYFLDEEQNLSFFVENFELLRVLHLFTTESHGEIGIGDLVHLRYLALMLPSPTSFSVGYLSNLETLNLEVSWGQIILLPSDVVKMVKLRHLYCSKGAFTFHCTSYDEREGHMLDSLQTLHSLCFCEHCVRLLKRTPNLRNLGLTASIDGKSPPTDLEFLKCLVELDVKFIEITVKLPLTLTRLTLLYTCMKWEELSIILQALPRLEALRLLCGACEGRVWDTTELEKGFSQLKYLKLELLDISEWNASDDQFPRLEVLVIERCKQLNEIPMDFVGLNELREIEIKSCSRYLEESAWEIQEKQKYRKGDDDDCVKITALNNRNKDDDTEDSSWDGSESGDDF